MFIRFCSRLSVLLFCFTGLTSAFAAAPEPQEKIRCRQKSLLLFHDIGIAGKLVEDLTECEWTHSGYLFFFDERCSRESPLKTGEHLPPLSQGDKGIAHCLHAVARGVCLLPFADVLANKDFPLHYTYIGLRPCNRSIDFARTQKWIEKVVGTPYEKNPFVLMRAIKAENKKEDSTSVFCSELIILGEQELSDLPKTIIGDNSTPGRLLDLPGFEPVQRIWTEKKASCCCACIIQ